MAEEEEEEELRYIAREMRRVSDVREYAETALKLESLVGDLEDLVLCVLKRRTGVSCSKGTLNPSEFDANQEKVLQAVNAIKDIENVLHQIVKVHPRWSHFVKAVDFRVDKIVSLLRPQVLADHRSLLSYLGWPAKLFQTKTEDGGTPDVSNPLVLFQGNERGSYFKSFLALSTLQHVQMQRGKRQLKLSDRNEVENCGLWAIEELATPIASRIEYHLMKWIAQPELMFALVYKITRDLIGLDDILQPLIDKANLFSCSAKEAWVSAMAQMLSSFLEKHVFMVLAGKYKDKNIRAESVSSWLHLVDLIIAFDRRMSSLFRSDAYPFSGKMGSQTAMPVLSLFCVKPDWLRIWVKMELKDAWKKLKAELETESSWVTDVKHEAHEHVDNSTAENFLLTSRKDHKAPFIAESALQISWEMMQRCETLPDMSCRIQFIRSTSSKLLWKFFNMLILRHEGIGLPANGSDEAVIKVCALVNTARFCEFKLQEWSEEVDLLELKIAENGVKIDDNVNTMVNAGFFDEEIKRLSEMQTSWLIEIADHIIRRFEAFSLNYFLDIAQFDSLSDLDHAPVMDSTLSHDLAEALDNLRTLLLLIQQHLNPKDFLDLWRSTAEGLDHFTFRSILTSNVQFSCEGVKQFIADMHGLFLVYRTFCARPESFFPFISDHLKLLKLDREQVTSLISLLLYKDKGAKSLVSHGALHISIDEARVILINRMFPQNYE